MSNEIIDSIEKEMHAYIERKVAETGEDAYAVTLAITRGVLIYELNNFQQ